MQYFLTVAKKSKNKTRQKQKNNETKKPKKNYLYQTHTFRVK